MMTRRRRLTPAKEQARVDEIARLNEYMRNPNRPTTMQPLVEPVDLSGFDEPWSVEEFLDGLV